MPPLPLIISVPHAGLEVPPEVAKLNRLSPKEIAQDGDEGAAEIYGPLKSQAAHFVTTATARAFVDLNRAEDDIRKDGVVKTHTCWEIPIYLRPLTTGLIETLLEKYHRPYHRRLSSLTNRQVILGVDCHTMAAYGPPVGPDPGTERPTICLGNAGGRSCPTSWIEQLAHCFLAQFEDVRINEPFSGGYISRYHGLELPWVQLEISRTPHLTNAEKGARVFKALSQWCNEKSSPHMP